MLSPIELDKAEYLSLASVSKFVTFFSNIISGAEKINSHFRIRDRRVPDNLLPSDGIVRIETLEQAFENYWWNGKDFDGNTKILNSVANVVSKAIQSESQPSGDDDCLSAIHEVLRWGAGGEGQRLYVSNMKWAKDNRVGLAERLRQGRLAMSSATPNIKIFSEAYGPRMNAGFTKYYAFACTDVVIYDGRVGAALGLITRTFCLKEGMEFVPEEISFRWGAQNAKRNPLNRDPSSEKYCFKQLPTAGGMRWAECNIRANWIISAALSRSSASWCSASDGVRRIEAALFTLGYEIPS